MLTIREANQFDTLSVLGLAFSYREEATTWDTFSIDYAHLSCYINAATLAENQVIHLLCDDGRVIGGMWSCVLPQVWTPDIIGSDLFLYIIPEGRSFKGARMLVKAAEEWASSKGAKGMKVGANSNINENRAAKALYRKLKYEDTGTTFFKSF